MKKLIAVSIAVAVALPLAVPALAGTRTVKVGDDYFVRSGKPPVVTVSKGTTVKWVWRGRNAHNVVASGPRSFNSRTMVNGTYKHKMTRRGTYSVLCSIHPGMTMKLKVR